MLDTSEEPDLPPGHLRAEILTVEDGGILQNTDGAVTLSKRLELLGSGALVMGPVELSEGEIVLEGGSCLINSSYITGCASLTLRDGSVFFDRISSTVTAGTALDASDGEYMGLMEWIR